MTWQKTWQYIMGGLVYVKIVMVLIDFYIIGTFSRSYGNNKRLTQVSVKLAYLQDVWLVDNHQIARICQPNIRLMVIAPLVYQRCGWRTNVGHTSARNEKDCFFLNSEIILHYTDIYGHWCCFFYTKQLPNTGGLLR